MSFAHTRNFVTGWISHVDTRGDSWFVPGLGFGTWRVSNIICPITSTCRWESATFRNRASVLIEWVYAYVTYRPGARLITKEDNKL